MGIILGLIAGAIPKAVHTASCIVARHSRTVSTLMRPICMPLKNGSSRFAPWARRSSQEPRVISALAWRR